MGTLHWAEQRAGPLCCGCGVARAELGEGEGEDSALCVNLQPVVLVRGRRSSGARLGNILAICSETENTSAARTTATSSCPVTRPTRGRWVDTGHSDILVIADTDLET